MGLHTAKVLGESHRHGLPGDPGDRAEIDQDLDYGTIMAHVTRA